MTPFNNNQIVATVLFVAAAIMPARGISVDLPLLAQNLTKPPTPTIELLEEIPEPQEITESQPPNIVEEVTQTVEKKADFPTQYQISLPRDSQPQTPPLPGIGEFVEMPGTNGVIELTRVTDSIGSINSYAHSYAKRSAIDPFNKYLLLNGFIFTLDDLKQFKPIPFGYEYVVSQTKEDEFIGFHGNNLRRWNAVTDEITDIWSGPGGSTYTIGQWEGQQSWDDRYVVVSWENGGIQLAVIDLVNHSLVAQMPVTDVPGRYNWADISPSGKYVLVGTSTGVFRFNTNLQGMVELNTNANQTGNTHGDMMYDVAGNEVYVQEGNFSHGDISYIILDTNTLQLMDLVDTATQTGVSYPNSASHISGQARDIPGRAFVSLQHASGMSSMFAVDLVPGQSQVYNWGHSHSTAIRYYATAKATISNDGTRVVYSSDWMTGGTIYTFMAKIK